MLNELCQLADALEKAGISPKEWHPQLKQLRNVSEKQPCYSVSVSENGSVSSIETINSDTASVLRKWEISNGTSFPSFNIQPLYRIITDEDNKEQCEQKAQRRRWRDGKEQVDIKMLKGWCISTNWDEKIDTKLSKCLKELPLKLLEIVNKDAQNTMKALKELIKRVVQYSEKQAVGQTGNNYECGFRNALESYIWREFKNSGSPKLLLPILVHEVSLDTKKNPDEDRGSLPVFLDIPNWQEYRVASRETIERINFMLTTTGEQENISDGLDAFGVSMDDSSGKLPDVKLPILGSVKLRAMNKESACQYRYQRIDSMSFPIGKTSRVRTKGALEWLCDLSREGETWGRADSRELLFAYPVFLPKVPLKLASCFGARKNDDSEARFVNVAKSVIQGLQGITNDLKNLELRVFALKKMDTARSKIVFHRNYSAQRLVGAAQEWENGCDNIPYVCIRVWGDEKGKWTDAKPVIPFPLQVSQCLNRIWKKDGKTACEAPVVAHSLGIELLLDEQPKRFVPYLLTIALQNTKELILSVAQAQHKKEIVSIKGYDFHKLLVPSILGLLLYKLGIKKESYMTRSPFLIGRMLKLADELHALYCKEVRDNKLPPQLIGNSLMTAALDSPVQALAQLALRLKPYYGWAQTFRGSENVGLIGYFVGLYGDVAMQLSKIELPVRFNDAERAQLLLGYLAVQPKKSENKNETELSENK